MGNSTNQEHSVYTVRGVLARDTFHRKTSLLSHPGGLQARLLHLVFPLFDGRKKQQLATTTAPCGLIKLPPWLLSVSLIRPLTWTSESILVYGYSARGP